MELARLGDDRSSSSSGSSADDRSFPAAENAAKRGSDRGADTDVTRCLLTFGVARFRKRVARHRVRLLSDK